MYGPPESAYDYFEDEGLPLPGPLPPEGGFVRPPGPSPAPGLGLSLADAFANIRQRLAAASNGNQVMAAPEPAGNQIMMEPGGAPRFYPAPIELPTPFVQPPVAIIEPPAAPPVLYPSPPALPPEPVPLPIEPGGLPGPIVGPNGPNGPAVTLAGIDPTLALILGLGVLSALLFSK